jgi:acyl dehydratase
VKIGDTITVTYEIKELEPERNRSRAAVTATNQRGETVGVAEHIMKWLINP